MKTMFLAFTALVLLSSAALADGGVGNCPTYTTEANQMYQGYSNKPANPKANPTSYSGFVATVEVDCYGRSTLRHADFFGPGQSDHNAEKKLEGRVLEGGYSPDAIE